jgi:hypothetical protein
MLETDDRPKAPYLLTSIALIFIGGAVQGVIAGTYSVYRLVGAGVIAALLLSIAFAWRKLPAGAVSPIRAGAERLANDFRIWFALGAVFFAYTSAMSVIAGLRHNNELATLRNDEASITNVLDRFVLPRQLTSEQINSIGSFLQLFPPQNVGLQVVKNDPEASQYLSDLRQAVEKGGWHVKSNDFAQEYTADGLSLYTIRPLTQPQAQADNRNPNAQIEARGVAGEPSTVQTA